MLTIRRVQLTALEADLFERWMDQHLRRFFPSLCLQRDLRLFIRAGIEKARIHGFTEQADMSGFIDLMLVLGEDFDQNPALPWAGGVLTDPGPSPPAARLEALRHFAHEWLSTGTVTSSVFTLPEPVSPPTEPGPPDAAPAPAAETLAEHGNPDDEGPGDSHPGPGRS